MSLSAPIEEFPHYNAAKNWAERQYHGGKVKCAIHGSSGFSLICVTSHYQKDTYRIYMLDKDGKRFENSYYAFDEMDSVERLFIKFKEINEDEDFGELELYEAYARL